MNVRKLKITGFFMVLCWLVSHQFGYAQSSVQTNSSPMPQPLKKQSAEEVIQQKALANPEPGQTERAIKNYKGYSANPEINQTELSILKIRAQIDKGKANGTMSESQLQLLEHRQVSQVNKLNQLKQNEHKNASAKNQVKTNAAPSIANKVNEEITLDKLITKDPNQLKAYQQGKTYITAQQFKAYNFEVQQYVINNRNSYVIVADASQIPTPTMSMSEFNSIPSDKQKTVQKAVQEGHLIIKD